MISFEKLKDVLKSRGKSFYTLRRDKVIGTSGIDKLQRPDGRHIDTRTIDALCEYLECQPGDIMEYTKS